MCSCLNYRGGVQDWFGSEFKVMYVDGYEDEAVDDMNFDEEDAYEGEAEGEEEASA